MRPFLAQADWQMIGSLADWSTALIAVAAFLVAGLAARATLQTNRAQQETLELQRKQYQASQDRDLRLQAEQVVFWAVMQEALRPRLTVVQSA